MPSRRRRRSVPDFVSRASASVSASEARARGFDLDLQRTQAPLSMSLIYEEPSGKRRSLDLVCQVKQLAPLTQRSRRGLTSEGPTRTGRWAWFKHTHTSPTPAPNSQPRACHRHTPMRPPLAAPMHVPPERVWDECGPRPAARGAVKRQPACLT